LNAYLQHRSGAGEKGRLIGTNNFLNMAFALAASAVVYWLHDSLEIKPDGIILIFGLFTLASTVWSLLILPDFLIRFCFWLLTHSVYRIRIVGQEHVPVRGPALLVVNHMSMVDGFLVGACVQRFIRFMIYRPYYEHKALNWLFRRMNAIPVAAGSRRDVVESIRRAQQELRDGHVVCIFAEGAISRTGNLLPFKRGLEKIVSGLDVPVIPVHLDRLWGSIFSFRGGRFFLKWPERIPYRVTVSFGEPMPSTTRAHDVRQAILELGSRAIAYRRTSRDLLHLRFIRAARRRWFGLAMADSSGATLTCGRALTAAIMLARMLCRRSNVNEKMIGVLLPASVGGALANLAVLLAGRVPVNLNFTVGREALESAISQCEIRTIITARAFLAKTKIDEREGMVFIEQLTRSAGALEKFSAALTAALLPTRMLQWLYNRPRRDSDSLATVIFSSGSTGEPKGVMLSHHNIISNIEALGQVFWVTSQDRFLGVLPFFHSFGFTCTLWFPLACGFAVVYHPNPMDAKGVGEMVEKHKATFLMSTPTFYASYLRRATKEQFASLRFAMVGGEKLRETVARAFQEKYGLDLCEGYGATEMSPVVSANMLNVDDGSEHQTGFKPGTVGHPLPGVVTKIVDPATGEPRAPGEDGLLLVAGPNRMLGYLNRPDKTAEVFRDGWYDTGDIAAIDDDGFIRILDRLSRFSKIGGEMVPHIRVEEAINEILGEYACCVTALPDESKGERLVVLYTKPDVSPADLWQLLSESQLPKLWIPKQESFYQVEALPLLGTGKLDVRKAKEMARGVAG
jgi:acyl-[acyl-carrier-protein]-phospholipid O-acyltransferase / long-chain-fatty-acid--[acyl-carrier-protein] ligase